jgi:hypothetical protein
MKLFSASAFTINAIRELLKERESSLVKINRDANRTGHELAQLGRVKAQTEFWLGASPVGIAEALAFDCKPVAV